MPWETYLFTLWRNRARRSAGGVRSDGLALCVSPLQRPRTDLALLATASPVQPVHLPSSFPSTYHAASCG